MLLTPLFAFPEVTILFMINGTSSFTPILAGLELGETGGVRRRYSKETQLRDTRTGVLR